MSIRKKIQFCCRTDTSKNGEERWTNEMIRGALVHKRVRKYQHDWLYLQSINSIKHQQRRHLGFGVYIDICPCYKRTFGRYVKIPLPRLRWNLAQLAARAGNSSGNPGVPWEDLPPRWAGSQGAAFRERTAIQQEGRAGAAHQRAGRAGAARQQEDGQLGSQEADSELGPRRECCWGRQLLLSPSPRLVLGPGEGLNNVYFLWWADHRASFLKIVRP